MTGPTRPVSPPEPLLERLARTVHGKAYVDSPHVFYAGPGIHDEAKYEHHPFETCPAPTCVEARATLDAARAQDETGLLREAQRIVMDLQGFGPMIDGNEFLHLFTAALATTSAPDTGAEERLRAALEQDQREFAFMAEKEASPMHPAAAAIRDIRAALGTARGDMDEAWAAVETALPADMPNMLSVRITKRDDTYTAATVRGTRDDHPSGVAHYERFEMTGDSPTPTSALLALAAVLSGGSVDEAPQAKEPE
jgi:hypothetical protein